MSQDQSSASDLAAPTALMVELLEWVTVRPRTYAETMEAWRTSCPRMPVWEDALGGEFVEVVSGERGMSGSIVRLTALGRALLANRQKSR